MLYGCVTWSSRACHYDTMRRAHHNFLIRCIGWRKNNCTNRPISYLDTLIMKTGSESTEAIMLRKAGVAHVDRRLLRYYLIVRRLPNVFTLACRSLGSIYYDTGSPRDGKTPFGWLHPCRLVTDSRRYLIIEAPATMPLHSSFIFTLNNRASTIS